MICPACESPKNLEIVMHADGYAKNLLECSRCGSLWTAVFNGVRFSLKKLAVEV